MSWKGNIIISIYNKAVLILYIKESILQKQIRII